MDPSYDGDSASVSRSHVTKHSKYAEGINTDNSSSSTTSSDEDDTSQCDMEDSAYVEQTTIPTEIGINEEGNNTSSKEENDHSNKNTYLGNEWTWNSWENTI